MINLSKMTAPQLKAFQLAQKMGLEPAKEHVKTLLSLAHEPLEAEPNAENSHAFQYWGDVMDELNEMEE